MSEQPEPLWSRWARELQAIAQNGLHYSQNAFDVERYMRLREIAAEMWAQGTGLETTTLLQIFSEQFGYATPKVDVRVVVFQQAKILLVQEQSDGGWSLPGGWADANESPSEAIVREIFEESGYQTRAQKLLAVYDRSKQGHRTICPFHVYKLFIRCEPIGGKPTPSHETLDVQFFTKTELEALFLSESRTTRAQLQRMFVHLENPSRPADFD